MSTTDTTTRPKSINTIGIKPGDTIQLQGGRLEDHDKISLAEKYGRIVPNGPLWKRGDDAQAFLEFVGFKFLPRF